MDKSKRKELTEMEIELSALAKSKKSVREQIKQSKKF